ncbi:hypothetical protein ACS8E6_10955 [Salinicola halophyticus]
MLAQPSADDQCDESQRAGGTNRRHRPLRVAPGAHSALGIHLPMVPGIRLPKVPGIHLPMVPGIHLPMVPGIHLPMVPGIHLPMAPANL